MIAGFPTFFYVAPNAAYIAAAQAYEVGCLSLVITLALQRVKMLHYRELFYRSECVFKNCYFHLLLLLHSVLQHRPGKYFSIRLQWSWGQHHPALALYKNILAKLFGSRHRLLI